MTAVFFGITSRTFKYSHTVGRPNTVGPGFSRAVDLAVTREGVIYVLNRGREDYEPEIRITVCTIGDEDITYFARYGEGDGEFIWPSCIALDRREELLYVGDAWLNRISVFTKEGQFLGKWGVEGSREGELNRPCGLAFDLENRLYVVDGDNHRVQKFSTEGRFLSKFGSLGSRDGELNMPWGITVDHTGSLYVADWGNSRIQQFTPDGEFLMKIGGPGDGVAQFNHPSDVAVDQDGDIYVTDWANHRVQVFTPQGRFVTALKGDSEISKTAQIKLASSPDMIKQRMLIRDLEPERRFWYPVALDCSVEDSVLILDGGRNRIQVYKKDIG